MTFSRRLTAEGLGTAFLLAAVVGSGIMGERLSGGNVAIALLANTIATAATLVTLILMFGPISGAHFNPAVTLADASQGGIRWREVPGYLAAQLAGAVLGVSLSAREWLENEHGSYRLSGIECRVLPWRDEVHGFDARGALAAVSGVSQPPSWSAASDFSASPLP